MCEKLKTVNKIKCLQIYFNLQTTISIGPLGKFISCSTGMTWFILLLLASLPGSHSQGEVCRLFPAPGTDWKRMCAVSYSLPSRTRTCVLQQETVPTETTYNDNTNLPAALGSACVSSAVAPDGRDDPALTPQSFLQLCMKNKTTLITEISDIVCARGWGFTWCAVFQLLVPFLLGAVPHVFVLEVGGQHLSGFLHSRQ